MPSDDEDEYGNITRRAPVRYPFRLMERFNSPEPKAPKSTLKALNEDEHLRKKSPEQLEKERLEEIADTIRADKKRAEENRANQIAQMEEDRITAQKKAANRVLQANDDQGGLEERVIKKLRKGKLAGSASKAKTGEGNGDGNVMK
ncbi:hypothetical protein EYC84_002610 [Monilinia fructicola]|uniref:Casein kinase substrate phosphoprotein PP28 domain-containing protein n=1 Tax=Monilinia fructicola TaxID=38448 RepID=A0A5M9JNM3_MONFR|nr:hypothetical protein EYC84_002610 [Monilinia fructicola]